jgi:hypothetical protein
VGAGGKIEVMSSEENDIYSTFIIDLRLQRAGEQSGNYLLEKTDLHGERSDYTPRIGSEMLGAADVIPGENPCVLIA